MVIAAAGKIDEDRLLALAEARFGDLAPGRAPPAPAARFAPRTHHDLRRFDQLHLAFAIPGVAVDHPDHHALTLYAGAAGGGMSSRLFQELREARGLAYSVYAWNAAYGDAGSVGVYLATARRDGTRALELAREVMAQTAEQIDEAELARAKAQARAGLLMGLESVQARCDHLARNIQVFGRIISSAETVAAIDAVTVPQLRAAAQAALAGGEALASVGGRLAKAA
jgi:predicted Zn-dependent peptidase